VEVAIVGRFGFVGVPVLLGTLRSPHRCVVRIPGRALCLRGEDFDDVRFRLPRFQQILHQYVQALLVQYSQVSLCNVRHTIEQRLCRWLLVIRDRIGSDDVPVTHDLLSQALGVRRAGVTAALAALADRRIVARGRGRLHIRDFGALEESSCECYRIIRREYAIMIAGTEGVDGQARTLS
jgi:CRP-like cAMP-binding protein